MTAIIAEKPSVARDIARVLGVDGKQDGYIEGNGYMVTWSFGHLVTLAPPEAYGITGIPVFPDTFKLVSRREKTGNGNEPDPSALRQLKIIRSVFDKCRQIIVATDAGREGELIFRFIYRLLECDKPFSRLWISSLTDRAITEGFKNLKPGSDCDSLYLAAEARSQADWLVGINASRALSQVTGDMNSSLGRVQTPTLAMVCARYEENRNFKAKPYRIFKAGIEKDGIMFRLTSREKIFDRMQADALFGQLSKDRSIRITKVEHKETSQEPPLLYDLTGLQQDANKRHGFSADRTLTAAQKLYESQLISYPRTGSRYIPEDVFAEIPSLIYSLQDHALFGSCASGMDTGKLNKRSVDDQKITDHHALIPTGIKPGNIGADEKTVYEMIAGRMLEAFSPKCVGNVVKVQAESDSGMLFETAGSKIKEPGWRAVFNMEDEKQDDEDDRQLPSLSEGEQFTVFCSNMLEKQTGPKPLFTEATLLGAMKSAGRELEDDEQREAMAGTGIGTPATRAGIIETLFKRGYMERDRKNLVPTPKGIQLYRAVKGLQIADVGLTGEWEIKLAQIEKHPSFREVFSEEIREYTRQTVDEISGLDLPSNTQKLTCPKCKSESVTVYGKVARCGNPHCNMTVFKTICGKSLSDNQVVELIKKGKTGLIKGFKSKQGKSFDASLKFDDSFAIVFEFAKNRKK